MNLSFAGCGFLGLYHTGVVCCIQKYAPQLILNSVSGASAGAMAACALLSQQPVDEMVSQGLKIAKEAREGPLGPFSPSFDLNKILADSLHDFLPEDAHLKVNGKLHVSLTRVRDGKNVLISHFDSKDDLIQAVIASTFIPVFSGFIPPKYRGVRYIDGGFSNNLPIIDEHTVTVSPFGGESDICPKDNSYQLYHINLNNSSIELSKYNMYRFKLVLFPPEPEVLSQMCRQGFEDTLRFLYQNGLLSCSRCLEIQSTFVIETNDECNEYDPECTECKSYRMEVLTSSMPEQVVRVFQDAIERANEGILNWIYNHRGVKMLSLLTLPYTVSADAMYATAAKVVKAAPYIGNSLWKLGKGLVGQVSSIVNPEKLSPQSTKISLHVSVAEYNGGEDQTDETMKMHRNNKMDLNFTVDIDNNDISLVEHSKKFKTTKLLSRTSSLIFGSSIDSDTFEHIVDVTTRHDALISYYYMDEHNKVKVTEIYEIDDITTDKNLETSQPVSERKVVVNECDEDVRPESDQ